MTQVHSFSTVPRIFFGPGARKRLGEEVARLGTRPLLIASRTPFERGDLESLLKDLHRRSEIVEVMAGPPGEPELAYVERALLRCREPECDVVVGVGGGSVLDAAKAVAALIQDFDPVRDIFYRGTVSQPGIPCVAVPTTAGTGSEVTPNSVLIDPDKKIKQSIRGEPFLPRVVVNDPELTIGIPRHVKVWSGADALTQAIESFTSLGANEITNALALRAFTLIARSLADVVEGPEDAIAAHTDMAYGSMLAGMALANARLGAVHGMAHSVGARYAIPHGICCAVLLPHVMEFNKSVAAEKYSQLSEIVGQPVIAWVSEIFERIGIPTTFANYATKSADIKTIAQESLPSGSLKANPRKASNKDLARILGKVISR